MHDWPDIEASRQRREDLLREAATRHLARNLPEFRPQRRLRALLHTIWWEIRRDLQRVSKLLRAEHERTDV